MARVLVVLAAAAVAAAASSSVVGAPTPQTTAVCATHTFTMTFDPKRQAAVTDGTHVLASVSFRSRAVSSRCRRVGTPKHYDARGLGVGIRGRTSFRCLTNESIRVHVNPIRNGSGAIVGGNLVVGVGSDARLRVIASAVLKNKGDPHASRVYRSATYCKLGA
jgi:hypothetical protein